MQHEKAVMVARYLLFHNDRPMGGCIHKCGPDLIWIFIACADPASEVGCKWLDDDRVPELLSHPHRALNVTRNEIAGGRKTYLSEKS